MCASPISLCATPPSALFFSERDRGFELGRVCVGIAVGRSASSAIPKSRNLTKPSYSATMFFGFEQDIGGAGLCFSQERFDL
jgi:hypothetical protein